MKIFAFASPLVLAVERSKVKNLSIITDEMLHDHQNLKHGEMYHCILHEATEKYDCYEPVPLKKIVEERLERYPALKILFEYHSTDCSETVELPDDDSEFKIEYEFESLEELNEFKLKLESLFEDILPPGPGVAIDAKLGKESLGKGVISVYLPMSERQDGLDVGKVKEIVDESYELWSLNKSFECDEHLDLANVEDPQHAQEDIELANLQEEGTVGKQGRAEVTTPSKRKQNGLKQEPFGVVKKAVKIGQKQKTKNDLPTEHSEEKNRNSEEKNRENEELFWFALIGMGALVLVMFAVKHFCA